MTFRTFISILTSALLLTFYSTLSAQDSLIFTIRVDDIMSQNTTYLPRSIEPFEDTVSTRGGKITWAVIPHRLIEPQNQDGDLIRQLQESYAQGNEIAQHGYNHLCPVCYNYSHEMWCAQNQTSISYTVQESLFVAGRDILEDMIGVDVRTFVPPGHAADSVTYRLLTDYSIPWLSTTGSSMQEVYSGLYNLAPTGEYTWAMSQEDYDQQLEAALADINAAASTSGFYCIYFHDYFIREGYNDGIVLDWTAELLDSVVATYGDRVQFMTINEAANYFTDPVSEIRNGPVIPNEITLLQNYPNPFNPETTIRYALPMDSKVRVTVYSINGELVGVLKDTRQSAGDYAVKWNASALSSGIYFYSVETEYSTETGKVILIK